MKNIAFPLLAALLELSALSCKKKEETQVSLPEATHVGANTFGCIIDGKPFVTSGKSYTGHPTGVTFISFVNGPWKLEGRLGREDIHFAFDYNTHPNIPGTFLIAGKYPLEAWYFKPIGELDGVSYFADSLHTASITITYYDGKVAAGNFYFDGTDGQGGTVHITDGRFDIAL